MWAGKPNLKQKKKKKKKAEYKRLIAKV